ncbi:MAG: type II toxin-antitoxin system PemK/MazF family toxin [Acidimicrobiales bacterium]
MAARPSGDLWAGEPAKNRPAVVVSVDDLLAGVEEELLVVPVSSSRSRSPLRPQVTTAEGVDRPSVAVCPGIRAVARGRFHQQVGTATPETVERAERALATVLGIEPSSLGWDRFHRRRRAVRRAAGDRQSSAQGEVPLPHQRHHSPPACPAG